ncbi:MAG: biotin/lipoyl-containing protein [Kouleothrix sp.]
MAEVTMPRLSDTMSEGSVGRWLKKPGDTIENGEIIAEIETDKATMELQSFESGTLQQILVEEGKIVPIGQVIALIGDGAAAAPAAAPAQPPAAAPAQPAPAAAPATPAATPAAAAPAQPAADQHIKASPLARKLAAERGIDRARCRAAAGRPDHQREHRELPGHRRPSRRPRWPPRRRGGPAGYPRPRPPRQPSRWGRSAARNRAGHERKAWKLGVPHIYVKQSRSLWARLMQLRGTDQRQQRR